MSKLAEEMRLARLEGRVNGLQSVLTYWLGMLTIVVIALLIGTVSLALRVRVSYDASVRGELVEGTAPAAPQETRLP